MRVKAVLFDLDGVILDSEKIYKILWQQAANELGFELAEDVVLQLRSCDSSIACGIVENATGVAGSYAGIRAKRKALMKAYLLEHTLQIKPGVHKFLSELQKLQIKKVIVTAAAPDEKIPVLEKLGILRYFDDIISVKDVGRNKPYPDLYLFVCNKLNLKPNECLAIEDAPNGIKSAYDAGVNVVMVPDLSAPDDTLMAMCTVVDRIDQVYSLL